MQKIANLVIPVFLVSAYCSHTARAQPLFQLSGSLSVEVADGDRVLAERSLYRLYGTPTYLRLQLMLRNDAASTIIVTPGRLEKDVTFVVTLSSEVATVAEWHYQHFDQPLGVSVVPDTEIPLATGKSVGFIVNLRRADSRPFEAGRYVVQVSIATSGGRVPIGNSAAARVVIPPTLVSILTGPPADTPADRAAAHRQSGNQAIREGRFSDAVSAFQSAVTVDPSDRTSLLLLGRTYLNLNRFRDAIPLLEQVLTTAREAEPISTLLAMAYLGVNDELKAARVLRAAGHKEERIREELSRLRATLARRRP